MTARTTFTTTTLEMRRGVAGRGGAGPGRRRAGAGMGVYVWVGRRGSAASVAAVAFECLRHRPLSLSVRFSPPRNFRFVAILFVVYIKKVIRFKVRYAGRL